MTRLKSDIWVHALLRRCAVQGLNGAVVHRGAAEAGAVFVIINQLNGLHHLLVPPPGPAYDDIGDRQFEMAFPDPKPWPEISAYVAKRRKTDPDIWVVEIEDRHGLAGLDLHNATPVKL
jgi:hypothetical protein